MGRENQPDEERAEHLPQWTMWHEEDLRGGSWGKGTRAWRRERRSCNGKRCVKGEAPAQLSKENVLYIMDKTSLAGQPHSLEIILEATSRDKTKTQWFVIGQSVPYFTSCFTPTMAGAVPWLR